MNIWTWIGLGIAVLFSMYGTYVWGFVNGCEHASTQITEELITWHGEMEKKCYDKETLS